MSYSQYSYQKFEKHNDMNDKQKLLYLSIGMVLLFITILCAVDYMLGLLKPEFIKVNGKLDRNRHFSYSIGISCAIYLAIVFSAQWLQQSSWQAYRSPYEGLQRSCPTLQDAAPVPFFYLQVNQELLRASLTPSS